MNIIGSVIKMRQFVRWKSPNRKSRNRLSRISSPNILFCPDPVAMDIVRACEESNFSGDILAVEYTGIIPVIHIWMDERRFCDYSGADDFLLHIYMESG